MSKTGAKGYYKSVHGFRTTRKRSRIMSKIRSTETGAEVILRKILWSRGYRYRKNVRALPGNPDIAFIRQQVAVFVDGEYWHGYNWEDKKKRLLNNLEDAHRREYWIKKIERNMERDQQVTQALQDLGWVVLRFWSKQVTSMPDACADAVCAELSSESRYRAGV